VYVLLSGSVDDRRDGREFAIKKFKPDKEGEAIAHYSGISQSAVREMAVSPFQGVGVDGSYVAKWIISM
jgi:hypothetical protein